MSSSLGAFRFINPLHLSGFEVRPNSTQYSIQALEDGSVKLEQSGDTASSTVVREAMVTWAQSYLATYGEKNP